MPTVKISEIKTKIGTSCIICNNFIELKHPQLRENGDYVCNDCKAFIDTIKSNYHRIMRVVEKVESNETREQ